jgi:hypothetical protein
MSTMGNGQQPMPVTNLGFKIKKKEIRNHYILYFYTYMYTHKYTITCIHTQYTQLHPYMLTNL